MKLTAPSMTIFFISLRFFDQNWTQRLCCSWGCVCVCVYKNLNMFAVGSFCCIHVYAFYDFFKKNNKKKQKKKMKFSNRCPQFNRLPKPCCTSIQLIRRQCEIRRDLTQRSTDVQLEVKTQEELMETKME